MPIIHDYRPFLPHELQYQVGMQLQAAQHGRGPYSRTTCLAQAPLRSYVRSLPMISG